MFLVSKRRCMGGGIADFPGGSYSGYKKGQKYQVVFALFCCRSKTNSCVCASVELFTCILLWDVILSNKRWHVF